MVLPIPELPLQRLSSSLWQLPYLQRSSEFYLALLINYLNHKKRFYSQIFRHAGDSYHKAMLLCPNARNSEFDTAVELLDLRPGQRILDVPAGGAYLNRYLPASVECTAIDFAAAFTQNREIAKCSETNFDLADDTFDRVVCMAALHHIEDRAGFFAEVKRVLKPTGVLLLADVLAGSQQAIFLNGFVNKYSSLGHQGDFLRQRRETTELQNLGFSTKTSKHRYNWKFAKESIAHDYLRLLFHLDLEPSRLDLTQQLKKIGFTIKQEEAILPWSLTFIEASVSP